MLEAIEHRLAQKQISAPVAKQGIYWVLRKDIIESENAAVFIPAVEAFGKLYGYGEMYRWLKDYIDSKPQVAITQA